MTRACEALSSKPSSKCADYMAKAKTRTGLSVAVNIIDKIYEKGRKVAEGFKNSMQIVFDNILPRLQLPGDPDASMKSGS